MKAVCIKAYFDNELHRTVGKGEELELTEERFKKLSTADNGAKTPLVKKVEEKNTKVGQTEKERIR